jgi:hypothetical protein
MIILTLGTCLSQQGRAQLKGFSIGPYAELASPAGRFANSYNNGLGVGLGADIGLGRTKLTGSIGYLHFSGKNTGTGKATAIDAFPILAGLKYRLVSPVYLTLQGGVAKQGSAGSSPLIVSPGIGLRVLGLDLQARYETWFNDGSKSFWDFRAAFHF